MTFLKIIFKYVVPVIIALTLMVEGVWGAITLLNQSDDLMVFLGSILMIVSILGPIEILVWVNKLGLKEFDKYDED